MKKKSILMSTLVMITVTSVVNFNHEKVKVNATGLSETFVYGAGKQAFEPIQFYKGMTTYTYRYFADGENTVQNSNASNLSTKHLDDIKTVTVTEEQVLGYYLHVPFDYETNTDKNYPVIVHCAGSGVTVFDHIYTNDSNKINITNPDYYTTGPYAGIGQKYSQTVAYGKVSSNGIINNQGNWIASGIPQYDYGSYTNAGASGAGCFIDFWYDQVINHGRADYDCFILFIIPTDEIWWENRQNLSLLTIHSSPQAVGIGDKVCSQSGGEYGAGYVASELSPAIPSQLTCSLIDEMMEEYRIDPSRQYLTGFSLGAQFSFDTLCHYPGRFAASLFSSLPASDITEETCSKLVNTNIWALNGGKDAWCPTFMSQEFVKKINSLKNKYSGTGTQQYSVFADAGHCGQILACNLPSTSGSDASGCGANCTQYSTDTLDFLFNSVRTDMNVKKYNTNIELKEKMIVDAKVSTTLNNNTYDLGLIATAPLGEFSDTGFILTPNDSSLSADKRSAKISCTNYAQSINLELNNVKTNISATTYKSGSLFSKTITGISKDITSFTLQSYATNKYGTIYGDAKTYNIVIDGTNVSLVEVD